MPDTAVRLAMIGGGEGAFIGAVHRAACALDGRFRVVAGAFSSDAARSRRSADAIGLDSDRGYPCVTSMLAGEAARPDGARAVAIVTPNHLHCAQIVAAANSSFAIFAEKPLAMSTGEAQEIADAIGRNDVPFALAHTYAGYPLAVQARLLVQSGALGAVRRVDAVYLQGWLTDAIERGGQKQALWRTDPALAGGGASGDIATHAHHLIEYVTGLTMDRVSARLATLVDGRKNDDDVSLLGSMSNGAAATLSVSQVATGRANGLTLCVYGDKAGLEWRQEEPDSLWLRPHGQPEQRWVAGSDQSYLDPVVRSMCRTPSGHPMGFIEALANLYRSFADRIGGYPAAVDMPGIGAGLRGMAFLDAINRSAAQNGLWAEIG